MPALLDRAFEKSLKRGEFERVYYFHGDDDFLKEQAVRALIAAAVDPSTRDFNLDICAAAELDAETLGSLLGTPPMMAERRAVVVRDVAALRKDARAVLDRYLASPVADVVLALVAPASEKAKVDKALENRAATLEFKPLSGDRVPRWIIHHVESVLGATITPEAAELLQQAAGNELAALAAELDKLASYAGGGTIDEDAVSDVVGVRRGETLGDREAARLPASPVGHRAVREDRVVDERLDPVRGEILAAANVHRCHRHCSFRLGSKTTRHAARGQSLLSYAG